MRIEEEINEPDDNEHDSNHVLSKSQEIMPQKIEKESMFSKLKNFRRGKFTQ